MANKLETALQATGYRWAYQGWSRAPDGDYGVWGEDYGRDFVANGIHSERGTRCYVMLFTRDATQTPRKTVEAALNGLRCSWKLNSVQYERDTGYVHYEWLLGIFGDMEVTEACQESEST